MNRRCNKIKLVSSGGYLSNIPYKSTLILSEDNISLKFSVDKDSPYLDHYALNMSELALDPRGVIEGNRQFYGHIEEDYKRNHTSNTKEKKIIEKIFSVASKEDFKIIDLKNVNDGDSLLIELYFDNGSKKKVQLEYAEISKDYGDLYDLLKLIDPLVPESEYKPEYFLFDD